MKFLSILLLVPALLVAAPKPLFSSKLVTSETPNHAVELDVGLAGAKEMFLVVTDGGNGIGADWADWAEPRLVMADGSEKKLTEVEWKTATAGWHEPHVNANVEGHELRSNGKLIEYGIGTHANSVIEYILPAGAQRFKARGVLDEGGTRQGGTSVKFQVFTETPGTLTVTDGSSHDPEDAVDNLNVHPELKVQLFASEPMMMSPSSIDVDARGRVWVCEVVNYRGHNGERKEGDRILILEDTDHDGKADKVTVFYQGNDVNSAHGICVLGNNALVSCGDEVFWLIDDDGDGKADRKEVMFSKIGGAQHDHGIHAFHFGPDGRLYFNHGNAAKQLCDKNGNLITDIHGVKCTNQNNRPYQQGMVYRCDLDGSHVEALAWNFRNNWEVAVDSFGTMWQSDNDDDGNKGVRINYVMEYGNYGYSDEMTGAGWQTPRIGWEKEIPLRHWHQNDPGVIPNLLQTGAGSPTGMQVYEGDLLPSIFHGQPIHCDAGPNVVRGYITQADGAGYKAEIVNIMDGSAKDRWFRPSDVCTAPDGSLIVADWYDPGVGGHGMGDLTRGRLFRVTVPGSEKYDVKPVKVDTVEGAVEALKSPNESARYLAWMALKGFGAKAKPALKALFDDKKAQPQHRARALWALSDVARQSSGGGDCISTALSDSDENLRVTAIRAARQIYQEQPEKLREVIVKVVKDESSAVRREAAIALRFDSSLEAGVLSLPLIAKFDASDRWALEAMGIGFEPNLAAWDASPTSNTTPPS
ncbi:MAG: rane-bound dehydrogenase domain protein, partial [Verrucomicrobiaceae bacterium]|nr:rane-bound dehydrogenase domain protein [Verrucomicrobiaceae bacterium]